MVVSLFENNLVSSNNVSDSVVHLEINNVCVTEIHIQVDVIIAEIYFVRSVRSDELYSKCFRK